VSTYTVSMQSMNSAIDQAAQIGSNIQSLLQELESDCQRTLATWTGDAQTQYAVDKQKWDAAAANMPVAINTAHTTLTNIMTEYGVAEQTATQTFGG
jgi:WXG100 family type VII secretion target